MTEATTAGSQHAPIMVVEDDDHVRQSLSDALEGEGYDVIGAVDGGVALDLLRRGPRPCVILLDLWMPNVDGAAFRRWQLAESAWAGIPVIVVSAAPECPGQPDADAWLRKPVNLDRLLEAVARFC